MKLFIKSFITCLSLIFCCGFFVSSSFASTTPFRSANIITTSGYPGFTNLENCSATDGQTCDRPIASHYGNLYFRDFGNYSDFGIPADATLTKVRIRVTGKSNVSPFALIVGLSSGTAYQSSCINQQWASDPWILWQLNGLVINSRTIVADVLQQGDLTPGGVFTYCLQPYNFDNDRFIFRLHASTAQNWSANIDNFEIAFGYEPPATPTPTPTPTPTLEPTPTPTLTSTPSEKIPLVLIPGIGGSELKTVEETVWIEPDGHDFVYDHVYPANEKVWVNSLGALKPGNDDYFDVLRMNSDGESSMANMELTGTIITYDDAINFFISQGYTLNQDFFIFPYDWRKDIVLTAPLLDEKIGQIKQQTGHEKVDIIAHSMGGLVARNYIVDPQRAQNVRKLFTLGTPHLGSVKFLKALRHGDCLTIPRFQNLPFCLGVTPSEVKDVIQNMISAFELAPTQKYFEFYSGEDNNHPYPFNDAGDIDENNITGALNYSQTKDLLNNLRYNAALFRPAEIFHEFDNNLADTNGVEVINIAGSGLPTLGQIIEKYKTNILGIKISSKDEVFINGDQTVPLMSAAPIDYIKGLILLGDAKVFYVNQKHDGLVASGSALLLVRNILNNDDAIPDGVSVFPYSFKGTIVSGHSPINLHAYDAFGNHTGITSDEDFEENIPGSFYDTLDDAKFIYLPDDGQYTIKIEAIDQGSFDLQIRRYEDNIDNSIVLYENVPLTVSTKGEMALNTLSDAAPVLKLDENGDGIFDENIDSQNDSTETSSEETATQTNNSSSETSSSLSSGRDNVTPTVLLGFNSTPIGSKEDSISGITDVAGVKTFNPVVDKVSDENKNYKKELTIIALVLAGGIIITVRLFSRKNFLQKLPNYKNHNKPKNNIQK